MAAQYNSIFKNSKAIKIIFPPEKTRVVYWRYTILLNKKINRKKFKKMVLKKGIVIRETYLPLHKHPVFKNFRPKDDSANVELSHHHHHRFHNCMSMETAIRGEGIW